VCLPPPFVRSPCCKCSVKATTLSSKGAIGVAWQGAAAALNLGSIPCMDELCSLATVLLRLMAVEHTEENNKPCLYLVSIRQPMWVPADLVCALTQTLGASYASAGVRVPEHRPEEVDGSQREGSCTPHSQKHCQGQLATVGTCRLFTQTYCNC
jgi:hypothetical protein